MDEKRRQELLASLEVIDSILATFYYSAIYTNVHTFVEFTGLMTEYTKICRQSLAEGIDFSRANTHSKEGKLVVHPYNTEYLQEKLNCIFDNCYNIELHNHDNFQSNTTEPN
jgi:hypothetical protein